MKFIDLISFLRDFYGISNSSLKFKKLKHQDIEILFPFIKRCSIDDVNIEDISHGNIIGVYDKHGMIVYYYNPHITEVIKTICDEEIQEEKEYKLEIDLNALSKDELLKLRSKLRKDGNNIDAFKVTKQIRKVKEKEPKDYYKKKEKLLIKEKMYD